MKRLLPVCMLFLLVSALHAQGYRAFSVPTADGLTLSAQEWGNPKGPEIVFIHGLGQSHLSWQRQYESAFAKQYRIITYDLRGHGDSAKPSDPAMYREGKRWGDDLRAVITAAGMKRPVVVAWSLGGMVLLNYLQTYGGEHLGGVVLVDAVIAFRPEFLPSAPFLPALGSPDLQARSRGIVRFLRACFLKQPSEEDFEEMVAVNGMVPSVAQLAIQQMSAPDPAEVLASLKFPVLIVYGDQDKLVSSGMAKYAHELIPLSQLDPIRESGHAPFYEQSALFNSDVDRFLRTLAKPKRD
jgi:non-heme chloroperoxidase